MSSFTNTCVCIVNVFIDYLCWYTILTNLHVYKHIYRPCNRIKQQDDDKKKYIIHIYNDIWLRTWFDKKKIRSCHMIGQLTRILSFFIRLILSLFCMQNYKHITHRAAAAMAATGMTFYEWTLNFAWTFFAV